MQKQTEEKRVVLFMLGQEASLAIDKKQNIIWDVLPLFQQPFWLHLFQ